LRAPRRSGFETRTAISWHFSVEFFRREAHRVLVVQFFGDADERRRDVDRRA